MAECDLFDGLWRAVVKVAGQGATDNCHPQPWLIVAKMSKKVHLAEA
ncbi:hypothetical protein [Nitrosomonas sp. ANs5]